MVLVEGYTHSSMTQNIELRNRPKQTVQLIFNEGVEKQFSRGRMAFSTSGAKAISKNKW